MRSKIRGDAALYRWFSGNGPTRTSGFWVPLTVAGSMVADDVPFRADPIPTGVFIKSRITKHWGQLYYKPYYSTNDEKSVVAFLDALLRESIWCLLRRSHTALIRHERVELAVARLVRS